MLCHHRFSTENVGVGRPLSTDVGCGRPSTGEASSQLDIGPGRGQWLDLGPRTWTVGKHWTEK